MIKSVGRLYGLGIGPGDPELITVKALRLLQSASVVAYPIADQNKQGLARSIVLEYIKPKQIEIPLYFPFKLECSAQPYYDKAAKTLAEYLQLGQDVVVLCEGDPFFYGTFMYIYNRLADRFPTEVVPGVSSTIASAAVLGVPLTYRNDVYVVIPAILPAEILKAKLAVADAAVIIKLGRHFEKVVGVLKELGLYERAKYVEKATMPEQRIVAIDRVNPSEVPYFSIIVIPSQWQP
ncbi:precorrin-2 C20-methyltransferase [Stanieria cyanosphaera PCC 7437]|uniref:Precorrin-2 C20-methyltransferase n=1 Tax=Stanieria cyanosphaera (strain ATCC 29371 / PCC 7437) TaxID=111780 RepID=K9XQM0_STAC7|nr:precorrin-2 C(20)-methyltransferase [Stanieria cyanosphaera]AFZ34818.1 precorrin-2 C20-methyltransferase [Stanieria cyanosphaera PCC 7437]